MGKCDVICDYSHWSLPSHVRHRFSCFHLFHLKKAPSSNYPANMNFRGPCRLLHMGQYCLGPGLRNGLLIWDLCRLINCNPYHQTFFRTLCRSQLGLKWLLKYQFKIFNTSRARMGQTFSSVLFYIKAERTNNTELLCNYQMSHLGHIPQPIFCTYGSHM